MAHTLDKEECQQGNLNLGPSKATQGEQLSLCDLWSQRNLFFGGGGGKQMQKGLDVILIQNI